MLNRRHLLRLTAIASAVWPGMGLSKLELASAASGQFSRVRPGELGWPSQEDWDRLNRDVGGRLVKVRSPLDGCIEAPSSGVCTQVFEDLKNPYYLGDKVGLTQSLGWVDAWTSRPSVYAVAAENAGDVAAAVNFARENNLRLVVKGGGHSYQGTSNSADSLLIWTRRMNSITLHEAFVGAGCTGQQMPMHAVTVEAGAIWGQVYDAVTTQAGRYVQGGGCMTVGVAGLIQSGGFGSFSKAYGMAAGGLLEAEVVTADGVVRTANACMNPDLFWALKGGGGGSFGVVTRVTLRTHELPEYFGGVSATIEATSDAAFRRLIDRIVGFYQTTLFSPHWGEQIRFRPDNRLDIAMVFQGLDQTEAETIWQPFFSWVTESPQDFDTASAPWIQAIPSRHFWDPVYLRELDGVVLADTRPGAPATNVFWAGNLEETGQVLYGYQSAWLPASLLEGSRRDDLVDALFAASRHWGLSLHCNKGLAAAPAGALEAARATATNPAVLDAFALAISGAEGPPAYPGIAGHEPDLSAARSQARKIAQAMDEVRKLLPTVGSYVSEADFFDESWRHAYWGKNYEDLLVVKGIYDPDGLFFVHHGVGSERWSADGFTRLD